MNNREEIKNKIIEAFKNKCIRYTTVPDIKKLLKNLHIDISGKSAVELHKLLEENLNLETFNKYIEFLERFCLCKKDVMTVFDLTENNFKKIEQSGKLMMYCCLKKTGFSSIKINIYLYKISLLMELYDTGIFDDYKRVKKKDIFIEQNNYNIAEALYIINKSAKKSRDTKQKAYDCRKFSTCNSAKKRSQNLYFIKEKTINKLIEENRIYYKGIHKQNGVDDRYFKLYEIEGFTFHVPTDECIENELLDGELPGKIDSTQRIKTKLKYNQAVSLLERYTGEKIKGNDSNNNYY